MKYALALVLLVGCAHVPTKTAEDVAREVAQTADTMERALDTFEDKARPAVDAIDMACSVAPDSDVCQKANEAITRFELALDKAQEAVDAYRAFTGDFGAAARAMAVVAEAAAEVARTVVK